MKPPDAIPHNIDIADKSDLQSFQFYVNISTGGHHLSKFVIAAYRPLEGKANELLQEVKNHLPTLWAQGLATQRQPYVMRAADGTIIEVFEWKSEEAIALAHKNPVVLAMWERFGEVCDFSTLAALPECQGPFPNFEPVEF